MTTTAVAAPTLVIAEAYGPVIQGEGPSLGRRCGFIRTMGCNLHCGWCDSAFTWDADRYDLQAEGRRTPVADLLAQVRSWDVGLVVLTGGEPLLHARQPGWTALLDGLAHAGIEVEVETNGTVQPPEQTRWLVTRWNVSPKLAHAGDPADARLTPALGFFAEQAAHGRAAFKFVVRDLSDLGEVAAICAAYHLPQRAVWIMPEGTDAVTLVARTATLADAVVARGWNLTTRLHVLAWSDERGR